MTTSSNAEVERKSVPPPASSRRPTDRKRVLAINIECRQLTCADPEEAIDVPGGFRLHVTYTGGKVWICLPTQDDSGYGVEGAVISGADWIQIRGDGVAVFDARLTLAKSTQDNVLNVDIPADRDFAKRQRAAPDDFMVYAIIGGVADLGARASKDSPLSATEWAEYTGEIPVALPVRFEASGRTVNWGSPRFRALGANYERYQHLLRNQCVAEGTVNVKGGRVVSLQLDVYSLLPGKP